MGLSLKDMHRQQRSSEAVVEALKVCNAFCILQCSAPVARCSISNFRKDLKTITDRRWCEWWIGMLVASPGFQKLFVWAKSWGPLSSKELSYTWILMERLVILTWLWLQHRGDNVKRSARLTGGRVQVRGGGCLDQQEEEWRVSACDALHPFMFTDHATIVWHLIHCSLSSSHCWIQRTSTWSFLYSDSN